MKLHDFLRTLMLPLQEIDQAISQNALVVDLGCGEGVIAVHLARKLTRKVLGVDLNTNRIPETSQKNLRFQKADITTYDLKSADAVILSDVLHHIKIEDQRKILKNISKKLKKGGVLIIKEVDLSEFIRSKLTRFWDFVFYPSDKIYYHYAKELRNYLQRLGFKVNISRPVRFFPGSTTLFICRKLI